MGEIDKKTEIKKCIYDLYEADNQVPPHDVKIDQTAEKILEVCDACNWSDFRNHFLEVLEGK